MSANSFIFYPIVSALYAALAAYFWRTRWQKAAPASSEARAAFEPYIMLAPLVLHGILLFNSVIAADGVHLGVGNAVSVIVWLTVAIYWIGNLFYRIEGLQALVMPVAAVCAFLPALLPATRALPNTELPVFQVHLMIALLAYSFFTIASL
ncbi:MAG: cytochrome C biogenesis protein, partial [Betaproteobacteria bacterium]|nr:cytochrome C biogenesis protein [Betaproteobacteria bacterium]